MDNQEARRILYAIDRGIPFDKEMKERIHRLVQDDWMDDAKFKVGDYVYVLDGLEVVKCRVADRARHDTDSPVFYRLYEDTGRNVGSLREDAVFATAEELIDAMNAYFGAYLAKK